MIGPLIFALMLAQDAEPANDSEQTELQEAMTVANEKEICRRRIVDDPRAARGKKSKKICKTAEEWRIWNQRRTR